MYGQPNPNQYNPYPNLQNNINNRSNDRDAINHNEADYDQRLLQNFREPARAGAADADNDGL